MANNTGNTILALLTGTAVGVGLGLLYAPQSGEKTRKQLKDEADHLQDNLNKKYKETSSQLNSFASEAKKSIEEKLEQTFSNVNNKADDMLNKLEGELGELRKKNAELQKELKKK
ncbi:YtxH domain-containing protein [Psychroflexus montanilacus]|uniref:YtxH domain-containing protein n=1 Tax=Psychroflexus montanilacus TaxID=2873598 RepID=UPI001CCB7726|nr:YtxH domain-containing protein [Psychroflexus montanilacus]MBZ9652863.1 YtxH domain-containing protein [Psychroflexus montanilacus]